MIKKFYCDICNIEMRETSKPRHLESNRHKNWVKVKEDLKAIDDLHPNENKRKLREIHIDAKDGNIILRIN